MKSKVSLRHAAMIRSFALLFACLAFAPTVFAADPKTHAGTSGLYGLLTTNIAATNAQVTTFLTHADFVGVSARTYWRDIETTQGSRNWAYYDSMITRVNDYNTANGTNRKVILRLEAAWASPQWLLDLIPANELYTYYEKHDNEAPPGTPVGGPGDLLESMPAPWDATYLTHWKNFVAAFGARYNGNPTVAGVLISGCSRSTEMYLPVYPTDGGPDWYAAPFNYTPAKLIDAWNGVIDAYAAAFPGKPIGLSLSKPVADDGVVASVAAYGVTEYPWHFYGKISYWGNSNDPTFFPTAALNDIADGYTHGGLEPAGAMQGDVTTAAINLALSWHTLGMFEVYQAQRDNFPTLKAAIDTRRTMISNLTFTATPQSGQALLAWTITTPSTYPAGFSVYRKTDDFPNSNSDPAATLVFSSANNPGSGSVTDTGLTNGALYYYSVYEDNNGYTLAQATVTPAAGGPVTLLSDGFEINFNLWTDGGATDWDRPSAQKHAGSFSAHAGPSDNDLISDNLDTTGYSSLTVSFWYRDDDIDDDDNAYLQLFDGAAYDNRFELGNGPEDTWQFYTVTLNNSGADAQYFHANFRLKFEGTSLDTGENLWIDDVTVTAQ